MAAKAKVDKEEQEQPGLEENFALLEELTDQLSEDDLPLEEAFKLYSKGMEILGKCTEQIDRVEKKVMLIDGTPFEVE